MFHTGGAFAPGDIFADRAVAERKVMNEYVMPPEMLDPKRGRVSVVLTMPQKSRRKPITDDMAQMCADLKIEPRLTFQDAMAELSKAMNRMMFQSLKEEFPDLVPRQFARPYIRSPSHTGSHYAEQADRDHAAMVGWPSGHLRR